MTRSGSVHALNTRSRGTSKSRVMTSSRSDDSVAESFFVLIRLLPGLPLVEVIGQAIEALVPELLERLNPIVDGLETFAVQFGQPLRSRAAHADKGDWRSAHSPCDPH